MALVRQEFNLDETKGVFAGVLPKQMPPLDWGFVPALLWNQGYERLVAEKGNATLLSIALERGPKDISVFSTKILPPGSEHGSLTFAYVERLLKFLLWQKGAYRVHLMAPRLLTEALSGTYSVNGDRHFDSHFFGKNVYGRPLEIVASVPDEFPPSCEIGNSIGGHWEGCRIGFDLGGSECKYVALIDGKVVFSERHPWAPYFSKSADYHGQTIRECLKRAASHLPRVDAIGGGAAGIYHDNEVRVSSLFRGIGEQNFEVLIRPLFKRIQKEWGGIPFEIANDGEVGALSGAQSLGTGGVLGLSMGTSLAGGFVNPLGNITTWLNELAFVPVDYGLEAARDEWSGDVGCGVQYLSQQAVVRLAQRAGILFAPDMSMSEKNHQVCGLFERGNVEARSVYETIGIYLGHTIALLHHHYQFKHLLIMGGVMCGAAGKVIFFNAQRVIREEFANLENEISLHLPDEQAIGFGQAIAAASLPQIKRAL